MRIWIVLSLAIVLTSIIVGLLPFNVVSKVIVVCLVWLAALIYLQHYCVDKFGVENLSAVADFSQIVTGLLTALALIGAGILYYYDTQWDRKTSVEVGANAFLLGPQPDRVLVQVVLKVVNQSKQTMNLQFVQAGIGLIDPVNFYPDRHGDVAITESQTLISPRQKLVLSGETDYGYYELVAPCRATMLRVLVKIPTNEKLFDKPLVYERKVIVPIKDLCAKKVSEVRVPIGV